MKFTVSWTVASEQQLTRYWLSARDRLTIDNAVKRIEHILATDPTNAGESRFGQVRIMIVDPITVVFSVRPDDRFVKVVHVAYHSPFRYRP